ncbi:MAG TPA: serine hydrolase domain-containing protein, partial [Ktedonobacterales bacterium]|nr:serine hydrolase domain-containing protein [Ktedonobacterales bacterium]
MLFEIGSIGKSFTALVLMQLVEAGQIDLYAPVDRYLPWFAINTQFDPITIHHLLSHTAGITNGTDCAPSAQYEPYALRFLETAYPPGEKYYYSNVGYKTLGYLLEAVTGTTYRELLQTRILDPLGLRATHAITSHDTRRQLATGYGPLYDDRPFDRDLPQIPAPWLEYSCADGSPAMPVTDLATYARMILNQGDPLVTATSFAQMTQPIIPMGGGRFYGYGLITEEMDGRRIIGHGGGTVGFSTVMLNDMDDGFGITMMVNGFCDVYSIARYGLRLLHAARHALPLPEPPLPADPSVIEQATTYAGTYGNELTLVADANHLYLIHMRQQIMMEQRGPDTFYIPHPDFRRYLLRFERKDGQIVAA